MNRSLLLSLLSFFVASCGGFSTNDFDGDGSADSVDCAPYDPSIYLGASEHCSDGIDNDCDNWVDCEDNDCFSVPDSDCEAGDDDDTAGDDDDSAGDDDDSAGDDDDSAVTGDDDDSAVTGDDDDDSAVTGDDDDSAGDDDDSAVTGGDDDDSASSDRDGDGVDDATDNCPDWPNANQIDDQGVSGVGDACDPSVSCMPTAPAGCSDDQVEPNDCIGSAYPVSISAPNLLTMTSCPGNEDWIAWDITTIPSCSSCILDLSLALINSSAYDVDFEVWSGDGVRLGNGVEPSSSSGQEELSLAVSSLIDTYYIRVIHAAAQAQAQDYQLYFNWGAAP
jgi:hypothetical protein